MTPDKALSIDQAIPLLSTMKPNLHLQEGSGPSPSLIGTVPTKNVNSSPVDTVSISPQLQQTLTDVKKEESKKEQTNTTNNNEKPESSIAKVQIIYNQRGDLGIRYLDTASRLVYQAPSELMMQLKESLSKLDTSVNTKA